jgi:hypothetical protein
MSALAPATDRSRRARSRIHGVDDESECSAEQGDAYENIGGKAVRTAALGHGSLVLLSTKRKPRKIGSS